MSDGSLTLSLRSVLGFILPKRPTRTGLGAFGGVTVATLIDTFKTLFPHYINVAALTDTRLAIAGAFLANLDLLWKREVFPEEIEQKFAVIRRAIKEGQLSEAQAKLAYVNLIDVELKAIRTPIPAPAQVPEEIPTSP